MISQLTIIATIFTRIAAVFAMTSMCMAGEKIGKKVFGNGNDMQ